MTIETVAPDNKDYKDLEDFVKTANPSFDYKGFARKYNNTEVNFILVFEYHGSMMSNFVKLIESRGLERYTDYEYKATQVGTTKGTFKVVLKKLTKAVCAVK